MDAGTAGSSEQEFSSHEYQVKAERDEKIRVVSCYYPYCEVQSVCSEITAREHMSCLQGWKEGELLRNVKDRAGLPRSPTTSLWIGPVAFGPKAASLCPSQNL